MTSLLHRPSVLHRHGSRLLLLCLLGGTSLPFAAAQAIPWVPESLGSIARADNDRSGDRHRDWLDLQRAWTERTHQLTQRRLDQLDRCLERSRRNQERDQCLRRDLEARERQWQRDQRDWQQLIRRQGGIAQLSWPLRY